MDFSVTPEPPDRQQFGRSVVPPENSTNRFFYNKSEIRSGWRIVIYLSLSCLLYGLELVPVSILYRGQKAFSVSAIILGEIMVLAAVLGAAILMSRLEDRHCAYYGLPVASAFGKRFWQGAFIGFCEISLIVVVMWGLGAYSFGSLSFHGGKIIQWGVLWLAAALFIALSEEFLFRGYIQYTLAQGIGFWPAAILLSLVFAAVHKTNPGENWIGVFNIFCTGMLWAFTLRRTGSLWLAVGWHAAFDFGESFLYSVPDSGGKFEGHLSSATIAHGRTWLTGGEVGPEASVFAFITLILGAVLVHFWFPRQESEGASTESRA